MKLYSYFRSSAAYRVRIAFNLKGLSYETVPIHLQKEGGQNLKPEYRAINPQMRVPALKLDSGELLTQSLAIIEYLDEVHPQPPLLPRDPVDRAQVRALAQLIACDIHPINNLGPLRYLKNELGHDQAKIDAWYHHWVIAGFDALEAMVRAGTLCLRHRRHARRYLPGAAGRQCAAFEGAARALSERSSPSTPPAAKLAGLRQGAAGEPAGCGIGRAQYL